MHAVSRERLPLPPASRPRRGRKITLAYRGDNNNKISRNERNSLNTCSARRPVSPVQMVRPAFTSIVVPIFLLGFVPNERRFHCILLPIRRRHHQSRRVRARALARSSHTRRERSRGPHSGLRLYYTI